MRGFSWVIDGRLAGLPRPGAIRSVEEDLDFLRSEGIGLLVSLTERRVDPAAARGRGIEVLHLPIPDFGAPTPEQQRALVAAVGAAHAEGRAVGVHCAAGRGRTGTMLATCLVAAGMAPSAAVAEVRRLRPGSVETAEQERAVHAFHAESSAISG
jgi:atypical dual specificity phosphatase